MCPKHPTHLEGQSPAPDLGPRGRVESLVFQTPAMLAVTQEALSPAWRALSGRALSGTAAVQQRCFLSSPHLSALAQWAVKGPTMAGHHFTSSRSFQNTHLLQSSEPPTRGVSTPQTDS